MNRKGFTLIELLVVIIILLAIMVVALPSINSTLEKGKNKDIEHNKQLIESAAAIYTNDMGITGNTTINIDELLNSGYITKKEASSCSSGTVTCTSSGCTANCG